MSSERAMGFEPTTLDLGSQCAGRKALSGERFQPTCLLYVLSRAPQRDSRTRIDLIAFSLETVTAEEAAPEHPCIPQ